MYFKTIFASQYVIKNFAIHKLQVVFGKIQIKITIILGKRKSTFFDDEVFFSSELLVLFYPLLYCAYELYILEKEIIKKVLTERKTKGFQQ